MYYAYRGPQWPDDVSLSEKTTNDFSDKQLVIYGNDQLGTVAAVGFLGPDQQAWPSDNLRFSNA